MAIFCREKCLRHMSALLALFALSMVSAGCAKEDPGDGAIGHSGKAASANAGISTNSNGPPPVEEPGGAQPTDPFGPESQLLTKLKQLNSQGKQPLEYIKSIPYPRASMLTRIIARPGGSQFLVRFSLEDGIEQHDELWDAATGEPIGEVKLPRGTMLADQPFSPDGKWLVGSDVSFQLFNPDTGDARDIVRIEGSTYGQAAFSPDGTFLATAEAGGKLCTWDVATGERQSEVQIPGADYLRLVVLPGGKQVAFANKDHSIVVADLADGKVVHTFKPQETVVPFQLIPLAEGRFLADIGLASQSAVFDLQTGFQIYQLPASEPATLFPGGDVLQLGKGSPPGRTAFFNLHNGKQLDFPQILPPCSMFLLAGDGRSVVISGGDNALHFWRLAQ